MATHYERLREDVAALVAKSGAVTRASVFAVLATHPPLAPADVDEFDDVEFSTVDFA